MARTEPRTGPMHGVHPKPNAAPVTGAATGPRREGLGWNRTSRYSHGALRTRDPARNRAIATTTSPDTRVRRIWLRVTAPPNALAPSPSTTNTVPKPTTNRPVSRTILPTWRPSPARSSATSRPVTIDTYAGTSGSTHGLRNETNPPPNAARYPTSGTPSLSRARGAGAPRGRTAPGLDRAEGL